MSDDRRIVLYREYEELQGELLRGSEEGLVISQRAENDFNLFIISGSCREETDMDFNREQLTLLRDRLSWFLRATSRKKRGSIGQ